MKIVGVAALLALVASAAQAQGRIGTFAPGPVPDGNGSAFGGCCGQSLGQAFFAPLAATTLNSLTYTFRVLPGIFDGGAPATLSVFAFDGTPPVGAPLFQAAFTYPTSGLNTPMTFLPNIAVVGGARYIALVGSNAPGSATIALVNMLADSPANTTGDGFYSCNAATCAPPGQTTNVAVFEATFAVSAVPEPSTWMLMATGLATIAGVGARRKRAA